MPSVVPRSLRSRLALLLAGVVAAACVVSTTTKAKTVNASEGLTINMTAPAERNGVNGAAPKAAAKTKAGATRA